MNYGAHAKFVSRWLDKLEAEDLAADAPQEGDHANPAEPE
jgi:hypothetical protein